MYLPLTSTLAPGFVRPFYLDHRGVCAQRSLFYCRDFSWPLHSARSPSSKRGSAKTVPLIEVSYPRSMPTT